MRCASVKTRVFAVGAGILAITFTLWSETKSPSAFAADYVQEALSEAGVRPTFTTIHRTSRELREVVSRNLDPQLLANVQRVSGRDFQYQFANANKKINIGTIVLQYKTAAIAREMARRVSGRGGHFRNSKILICFSSVPVENLFLVAYSENSGDDRVVQALNKLPAVFEDASAKAVSHWSEEGLSGNPR